MRLGIKLQVKNFMDLLTGNKKKQRDAPIRKQEFSIGIYEGDSPLSVRTAANMQNPVLSRSDVTDVRADYIADPFMINVDDSWYMFLEVKNLEKNRGEIGLATSKNGVRWKYQKIILAEPFHMSYPYVFEWEGEYYMIPEAWEGGGVRLYKADKFPEQWKCVARFLDGGRIADSSIFRYQDRWWLFADTGVDFKSPVLRLYYSDQLYGPWIEHPLSPINNSNPHSSRPGGRIVSYDGGLIRFAQDVIPVYGSQVHAFKIQELSTTTYKEVQISEKPILSSGRSGWNSGGMHHIDAHKLENGKWLACVDGFQWRDVQI